MKSQKNKMIAMAGMLLAFSSGTFAQQTASNSQATAGVNIASPISITKGANMDFGNVVASVAGGTVILATDGTVTPSGVTILSQVSATAAEFTVNGDVNFTYYVTLPADNSVSLAKNGAPSMDLTDFTENSTGVLSSGSEIFNVGAKLHIGANQPAGQYLSSGFTVTVTYN